MRLLSSLTSLKPGRRSHKHSDKPLPVIKLEIVSDTVCPYCYLLQGRLHRAMKQFEGQIDFQLHWIPYQLQPLAPPEGISKHEFMEQKFKDQAHFLFQKKQEFFKSQGLPFSGEGVIGNTFNSHRLVCYAGKQSLEKADEVMWLIFHSFFAESKHINDAQVLREIGRAAQLEDPDRVADDPNCCADEVRDMLDNKYRYVIGVPHIVINDGQVRLGGAQEPQVLAKIFQELLHVSRLQGQPEA